MARSFNILVCVLLGALAGGAGFGIALHQANQDRARLAQQVEQYQAQAEEALTTTKKLADEANLKVNLASNEISKAQDLLKKYEEERLLMAQAISLKPSSADKIRSWQDVISLPLGVSLKIPALSSLMQTDKSLQAYIPVGGFTNGIRWLSILPFEQKSFDDLRLRLLDPTAAIFYTNGQLLSGWRGRLADDNDANHYLLTDFRLTSSTKIIWARSNSKVSEATILDTLATLSFKQ